MCLVRYLHPVDHHVAGIRKVDKNFADELDSKDKKFSVKIRDILRNWKNCVDISVCGYENMEKYLIYVSKNSKLNAN